MIQIQCHIELEILFELPGEVHSLRKVSDLTWQ